MMKTAFDIVTESTDWSAKPPGTLLLELNEKQITFAWFEKKTNQLRRLKQYHISTTNNDLLEDLLEEIVENDFELQNEIREAIIIYNLGDNVLVPSAHFSSELGKPIMEIIAGSAQRGLILNEKIPGTDIYCYYRIPRAIHGFLQKKFSAGKYWHFYSLLLEAFPPNVSDEVLFRLFFYPDKMVVAVFEKEKLQLIQTYYYQVPEDITFYLLSICQQFRYDAEKVHIIISGLIDSDSALFNEMTRYFLNIEWETNGRNAWVNERLQDYPSHYFASILQMALCVL